MKKNLTWWLIKIDRTAAWILFVSIFLYFLSGYGMTKGIIDRNFSLLLHENILPLIAITSFSIHTCLAIRLSLIRRRMWNKFSMFLLFSFYLIFFLSFFYFEFFYQSNQIKNIYSSGNKQELNQNFSQTESNDMSSEKIFTLQELSKYDGKDGRPAYVAVDGNVYDLTTVFANGNHYSHLAGKELTSAFYSKHVKSQLSKYKIVGKLK